MSNKDKIDIDRQVELRSEEFQEVLGSVPSWILRWGITLIAIIVLIILIGSAIFKYPDTISTSMTLTSSTPAASLVARTSGKIQELRIEDKQQVNAGDYLAIIENPANTEDIQTLKLYIDQLNQKIDTVILLPSKNLNLGSIQSLYSSFYITLFDYHEFKRLQYYSKKNEFMEERIKQYQDYYKNIIGQKTIVNEQFQLNKNQYQRDSLLNKKGVISSEELETSRNQYLQGYLSLENINSTIQNTQIQTTQMQENLLDTEYQYQNKKNQLEAQLKTYISQLISEIQAWELNYALATPIDGQVTFTNYWVKNQNVTVGEIVFTVIPNGNKEIIGKAQMALTRSGKVKTGQKVNIRFSNFPDNEFGIVKGFVKNISIVPVKDMQGIDYYAVEIELPDGLKTSYNKEFPYLPEMQAQADIITEDISLLERFFMPLRKIWTEGVQ
ncbi:multidrug resistance efflux pump [Dysgonomonas sp. PFB1-18]|uniref:HlyD family secretion protein n=1 Tax=unclassified Dysgonomonas TaxID=2630389 RepID=UPI002473029F|nr:MULTISPECIES: HlyD family efflux transporter periplasmic adaptor subunit [unclassified Dysgonomonas]MDH6311010.1 multidrug resistance efflux pump [Dysgonomonas sp. PF1-14]MDH6340775.1 multidrug resistance efflux pump [Dysgonomonas sp. PF1-16]MDH6382438.1 multidrug resistance efflux pump [Dysgonomonas sp. PFB1-18]MDH6399744.1 multidrug resistance efflux pump [Dysgonomonas sp. PF1-23]